MGYFDNITYDKFPKQSNNVGKRVEVCFHYDTAKRIKGTIVRDDREPRTINRKEYEGITIFKLDDGRYILASECHWNLDIPLGKPPRWLSQNNSMGVEIK